MKLFLGGGGGGKDSIELDKKFVAVLDLSKPLLYIPIATNTAKYPYSGCVVWLSSVLGPLGVTNIVMWTEDDLKTNICCGKGTTPSPTVRQVSNTKYRLANTERNMLCHMTSSRCP